MATYISNFNKPYLSVTTRWFNEARFAKRFLRNWWMADEIVVVDGGSTDNSEELLRSDDRVVWKQFLETVPGKRGGRRNPEGKHVNACLEAARGVWVIHQEADLWPTIALQNVLLDVLKDPAHKSLFCWLHYLAPGSRHHYPRLMVGAGPTGWHTSYNLRCNPKALYDPGFILPDEMQKGRQKFVARLPRELSRVHMTWETEEAIRNKVDFYNKVHGLNQTHPDKMWGPRALLPECVKWYDDEGRIVGGGDPIP